MTVFEKEFEIDESDESDDGCLDVDDDDDNMVMYFYCALGIL